MARLDKAPEGGKVKATAAAALDAQAGLWGALDMLCVDFDSSGNIIVNSAIGDAKGVILTTEGKKDEDASNFKAAVGGKAYTVIFQGEFVEMENSSSPALAAGDTVWASTGGDVVTSGVTGAIYIGEMLSDSRLFVNVNGAPAGLSVGRGIDMNTELLRKLGLTGAEGEDPAGFLTRSDAIATVPGTGRTVDGQPIAEIWNDLQARLTAFNGQRAALLSILTQIVDRETDKFAVYTTPDFEEASEFGRPSKIALKYVTRGFPLKHYDLGFGFTQEFLDRARGREIASVQTTAEMAWNSMVLNRTLDALFQNANATDVDGVVVKRLYNADGEVPPKYKRWTHTGTHTHYLFSGTLNSFDLADIQAIEEHLVHHGYGDFGEVLVIHAHRTDLAVARAATGWVPAETSDLPSIIAGPIVGATPGSGQGLRVQGYMSKMAFVENNEIPQGWLMGMAVGGDMASAAPVGVRVHENPSARGLRLIEGPRQNYPLYDAVYDGYTGAGVANRGSAVVMDLNTAYNIPTI